MAGHSKWANIKHRKGAQDAKRAKIFQKISKEIMVAIKEAGNDPSSNARLRLSIEKAKSFNIPNDNIKRLLEKGDKDNKNYLEINYEGYGPGGVAILIKTLTDNQNRTSPLIRSTFSKGGGNLGTPGSVSYLFENKGLFVLEKEKYDFNKILDEVIEMDLIDIKEEDDFIIIETKPSNFIEIKNQLIEKNINDFVTSEVTMIANTKTEINEENNKKLQKLIEQLEDLDDVQEVFSNEK